MGNALKSSHIIMEIDNHKTNWNRKMSNLWTANCFICLCQLNKSHVKLLSDRVWVIAIEPNLSFLNRKIVLRDYSIHYLVFYHFKTKLKLAFETASFLEVNSWR